MRYGAVTARASHGEADTGHAIGDGTPPSFLEDLRFPPGNHLEQLKGDRSGQHSIRINDQWRICFVWTDQGPADVEIVDYH